jgi:cob(I)alamin adenosyltransferase
MKEQKGLIHLYMGKGKGKTTASLGLALRAAGAGLQVSIIQFLKGKPSNEFKSIEKIPQISITHFGRNKFLTEDNHDPIDEKLANDGLDYAKKIINEQKINLLILDEITIAVAFHLLKKEDVIQLLKQKPKELTIVLTGRIADEDFITISDLVTDLKEIKHPFQQGIKPQSGIDF